jgi:hypothetical protein
MFAETISRPPCSLNHHHQGADDERLKYNKTVEMQGFEEKMTIFHSTTLARSYLPSQT